MGNMATAGAHDDDLDDKLFDGELESEIELVSELVVAATFSDGPLPQKEIDQLLGMDPKRGSCGMNVGDRRD